MVVDLLQVTFVELPAAPPEPQQTPRRGLHLSRRAWIALVVVAVLLLVAGGVFGWRQTHQPTPEEFATGYSQEQLAAVAALHVPAGFTEVGDNMDCQHDAATRCFVSDRAGIGLARTVARQFHAPKVVWQVGGSFGDFFSMCVSTGPGTLALVSLRPHVVNAKPISGGWTLPPGAKPKFRGTTMLVSMYGTSQCVAPTN